MAAERRSPGVFTILAVLLLVVPLGIAGWWWYRPTTDNKQTVDDTPDVVCSGRVDVPGQVIALEPSVPGRVIAVLVKEGQSVKLGQEILRFDDSAAQHRLKVALSAVELANVELDLAKQDELRFPRQLEARESLVNGEGGRVEGAEKMLEQRKVQGGVTPLGKAEMEAFQAQIRELRLIEKAQKAEYDDIQKLSPKMRVRAAEARLRAVEADKELAKKSVAECVLLAPGEGTILRLQASVGGIVSPGGYPIAVVFAPSVKFIIRAEVEQEYLGRVKEGMKVLVQDENRTDSGKRKGIVKTIGKWVAQRRTVLLEPGEINDVRTVECIIELIADPENPDADAKELYIGQRMRVFIQPK